MLFSGEDIQGIATSQNYLTTDRLGLESVVWSGCGADTILRANTSMLVNSNMRKDQAMATVDSADIDAGLFAAIPIQVAAGRGEAGNGLASFAAAEKGKVQAAEIARPDGGACGNARSRG